MNEPTITLELDLTKVKALTPERPIEVSAFEGDTVTIFILRTFRGSDLTHVTTVNVGDDVSNIAITGIGR